MVVGAHAVPFTDCVEPGANWRARPGRERRHGTRRDMCAASSTESGAAVHLEPAIGYPQTKKASLKGAFTKNPWILKRCLRNLAADLLNPRAGFDLLQGKGHSLAINRYSPASQGLIVAISSTSKSFTLRVASLAS